MGNNIKDLDALHQVMKGDMTVDQACEGMTDDFEIGHVSHRADGDYRKVAQGKWVPVRGTATNKSFKDNLRDLIESDPILKGRNVDAILKVLEENGFDVNGQGAVAKKKPMGGGKPAEQMGAKAKPDEYDKNSLLSKQDNEELLEGRRSSANRLRGQSDSWEGYLNILKEDKANGYDVDREIERVTEKVKAESGEKPAAEPKAEGGKRQLKRRADGTIIYETPDDVIYDMVENYNELDRGDLQGVIEAAAMSHGWDENEILEEVDRQAAEKYNLGVDSAAPRLTRDTKIRLSKIKREQTQDERRTYKIGEISEKTGLQKTANGWREVKKGASPAGGKMSKEDLTKRVGEMLKTDPTMRKMVGAGSAAPKADPAKMSKEQLTQRVSELMKTDKNLQKVVKAAGGTIPGDKVDMQKYEKLRDELASGMEIGKKRQSKEWYDKKKEFDSMQQAIHQQNQQASPMAGGKAK